MKLDHVVYALLFFGMFIVGGTLIWNDMATEYGFNNTDPKWDAVYGNASSIQEDTSEIGKDLRAKTLNNTLDSGTTGWDSMAEGAYGALRIMPRTFTLITNVIQAAVPALKIPPWIGGIFLTMIIISIVFAIIYMIFRFTGR